MANHGVVQSSGISIEPRDWLRITFKDGREFVGRFSGLYENPYLGLMYFLSFARPVDGSKPPDTIWCVMREGNGCEEALDNATPIEKPVKRKGKLVISPKLPGGAILH